ncbi:hypothetical protein AUK22_01615 [bacterium CG2_30_54_10]|nr:MAG: hypothetical protein AUK22_01615 [bacterium CG2_30_54_10]
MDGLNDLKPRILRQLKFALQDLNPNIRFLALEGVARFSDPSLAEYVQKLFHDQDKYVKWKAIQIAGVLGVASIISELEKLLISPDVNTRLYAAQALGLTGRPDVLTPLLDLAARETAPQVRQMVVKNLNLFGGSIPWEFLGRSIQDPDLGVRLNAASTLGAIAPNEHACDILINLLERESDNRVFATAVMSLGRFRKEILVGYFQHSLLHREPRIRANAVEAMGCLPFRSVELLLVPYLRDPSNRVKANVMGIFLHNGMGPRVIGEVRSLMVSPNHWDRASGAWLIGTYGVKELVPLLIALLNDEESAVAERAAWAIGKIKGPGLFEELLRSWGSAKQWALPAFLSAIKRIAALKNVPTLIQILEKDKNPRTKATVIDILSDLDALIARSAVEKFIKDPEQRIRVSALLFIAKVVGPPSNDLLFKALDDPTPRVRALCAEALLRNGDFRALKVLATQLTDSEKLARVQAGIGLRELSASESHIAITPEK